MTIYVWRYIENILRYNNMIYIRYMRTRYVTKKDDIKEIIDDRGKIFDDK